MRFFTDQHRYYCGIDLHARTMYLCILDHDSGTIVLHRNLRTEPDRFLRAIEPYREDLVVGVECIFCWYWLADLCAAENIPFVLGHALYMKAIHGGKAKNDRVDAHKIATLLRGGAFPLAYVYPRGMRATRDLMRRRLFFVRRRSELFTHIRITFHQLNLPAPAAAFHHPRNRIGLAEAVADPIVRANVEADLAMAERLDDIIRQLERTIRQRAQIDAPETLELLQTIPGVGRVLDRHGRGGGEPVRITRVGSGRQPRAVIGRRLLLPNPYRIRSMQLCSSPEPAHNWTTERFLSVEPASLSRPARGHKFVSRAPRSSLTSAATASTTPLDPR
jgi:transposase